VKYDTKESYSKDLLNTCKERTGEEREGEKRVEGEGRGEGKEGVRSLP